MKKIIDIDSPFIIPTGVCIINNGYYIVEVIPKNENYAMRVFFNEKKERLEYYFDISLENGLDEESKVIYATHKTAWISFAIGVIASSILLNGRAVVVAFISLVNWFSNLISNMGG